MSRADAVARAEELAEQLAFLGPATIRPMFGGAAVTVDGAMVAFVSGGTVYLRVDEATRQAFDARGVAPFAYERAGRLTRMQNYYTAPDDVLEDDDALRAVTRAGLAAALAAKTPKRSTPLTSRETPASGTARKPGAKPKAG